MKNFLKNIYELLFKPQDFYSFMTSIVVWASVIDLNYFLIVPSPNVYVAVGVVLIQFICILCGTAYNKGHGNGCYKTFVIFEEILLDLQKHYQEELRK